MNNLLKACYETNGTDGIIGTYTSLMSAISAINPIGVMVKTEAAQEA